MKHWWQRRTVRFRLALWYASVGTVLLCGFSATVYFYVARELALPIGFYLRLDLAETQRRLEILPDETIRWDGQAISAGAPWNPEDPWFELWDEQGNLVRRHWPFRTSSLTQAPVAPVHGRETISIYYVSPSIRLRVLSTPYRIPGRSDQWMIRLMRLHEPETDALSALLGILVATLPFVIGALVFGGYALTRRWLQPLDEMVCEANQITATDLGRRLPVKNPHDEIGRLATVFNVTLGRLDNAFQDLDRFVGDVAHELKTPLTAMRSVGEVCLRRDRPPAEYRAVIASLLEEAQLLQALVHRLLEFAGAQSGGRAEYRRKVQLDRLVAACADEFREIAHARGQEVLIDTEAAEIMVDPILVQQALRNLIDNALKYSPDGSPVKILLRRAGDRIRIEVHDEGPGISPEERGRIAERFFRAGRAGRPLRDGFGLGLSITKVYLQALGGALTFAPRAPKGSTFGFELPINPPERAKPDEDDVDPTPI